MKKIHAKSPCCCGRIIKFGNRRRQCVICHKTWRIRAKKTGRKRRRVNELIAIQYLSRQRLSCPVEANKKSISASKVRSDLRKSLQHFLKKTNWLALPDRGCLIIVADALVQRVERRFWTIYIILVKKPGTKQAVIAQPFFYQGTESCLGWRRAFGALDKEVLKSTKAIVCDGGRGLISYAKRKGWIIQRCHFHLLAAIQGRRSKSPFSRHRHQGRILFEASRQIITSRDDKVVFNELELVKNIYADTSSMILRKILSGFIKRHEDYRSYLKYPNLDLPTTSNAAESVISGIRDLNYRAKGFRTVSSLKKWVEAFIKHKKMIVCNGHLPTK